MAAAVKFSVGILAVGMLTGTTAAGHETDSRAPEEPGLRWSGLLFFTLGTGLALWSSFLYNRTAAQRKVVQADGAAKAADDRVIEGQRQLAAEQARLRSPAVEAYIGGGVGGGNASANAIMRAGFCIACAIARGTSARTPSTYR